MMFSASLALVGCGPKMEGHLLLGRVVSITNKDESSFTIEKIVANRNHDDTCTETPDKLLEPGETYNTTFFICGSVSEIEVDTDRGDTFLHWN